jgi:hypothetical protein
MNVGSAEFSTGVLQAIRKPEHALPPCISPVRCTVNVVMNTTSPRRAFNGMKSSSRYNCGAISRAEVVLTPW